MIFAIKLTSNKPKSNKEKHPKKPSSLCTNQLPAFGLNLKVLDAFLLSLLSHRRRARVRINSHSCPVRPPIIAPDRITMPIGVIQCALDARDPRDDQADRAMCERDDWLRSPRTAAALFIGSRFITSPTERLQTDSPCLPFMREILPWSEIKRPIRDWLRSRENWLDQRSRRSYLCQTDIRHSWANTIVFILEVHLGRFVIRDGDLRTEGIVRIQMCLHLSKRNYDVDDDTNEIFASSLSLSLSWMCRRTLDCEEM